GYVDAKYVVDGYEPKNYGDRFSGSVDLLKALQSSINVVAVKVLVDVGFEPVIEMAQKMGIQSSLIDAYSLALGSSEVNLLELTSAYGTLANQGKHVPVHGIRRVLNSQGEVLYQVKNEPVQAVDADTAAIMTWMLEGVVQGGTGGNAALNRPVAGKTGTSERNRDLWFVGYIPQLVTGVWLGNDDSTPTRGASSSAAYVWRVFMQELLDDIPEEGFPERPSLNNREGTIEAKPVKPGKVVASGAGESSSERQRSSEYSREEEPAPASRSSRSEPEPEEAPAPARERERDQSPARSSGGSSPPASGGGAAAPPELPAASSPPAVPAAPAAPPPPPIEAPPPAPLPAPAPAPAPPPLPAPVESGGAE
ncbi:MAG: penicillin-binding protein, partial [Cyanobacteria bacterium Co-bin13]|nr:penicillin-binding protein [Cyanobacteria bacterium Co-bin13]